MVGGAHLQCAGQAGFGLIDETGNLEVVKRYGLTRVPSDETANATYQAYHLTFEIELRNRSDQPQTVAYRLDGPTGLPLRRKLVGSL